jgi:hypothetical protein
MTGNEGVKQGSSLPKAANCWSSRPSAPSSCLDRLHRLAYCSILRVLPEAGAAGVPQPMTSSASTMSSPSAEMTEPCARRAAPRGEGSARRPRVLGWAARAVLYTMVSRHTVQWATGWRVHAGRPCAH